MKLKKKVKQEVVQDFPTEKFSDEEFNGNQQEINYSDEEENDIYQKDSIEEQKDIVITENYVKKLIEKITNNHHLNAVKSFLRIFRFIVNEDSSNKESMQENSAHKVKEFYVIKNSAVYTAVMTFCFSQFPKLLHQIVEKNKKNRKTEIIVKVFVINFFKFMDSTTDSKLIVMCLKSLQNFIDLIIPYPQFIKKYSFFLIEQFCTADQIQIKLHSFLVLKKVLEKQDELQLSKNLKKLYLNLLKNCKQVNSINYSLIQFMINCYTELMNINTDLSYTLIIQFMQQFITHLKMGYREKSKENIFMIYNWQIYNCFLLWTRISLNAEFHQLRFPLLQLISSMLNLFWTEKHFPLFLKFFELIRELTQNTSYMPIFRILIKMLQSQGFRQKKSQSSLRKFDFFLNLKVPKKYLDTQVFWNDLFVEILDQILLHLSDQSKFVHFPETCIFILRELKRIKKEVSFTLYKKQISSIIKEIEIRSQTIHKLRLDKSPKSDAEIGGKNNLRKLCQEIINKRQQSLKQNLTIQDNELEFSEEIPQEKKRKNKKKSLKNKIDQIEVEKDIISSEPSDFVDERPQDVFGEDQILSDYESLEGDPENIDITKN